MNAGGKRSGGEDKISRNRKKSDLPEKVCVVCGRPFTWRKKWEKVWDEVKYCSERCRRHRGEAAVSDGTATSRRGALSLGASILGGIMLMGTSGPQPVMASSALRPAPGEIEKALKDVEWPDEIPFTGEDFARLDTSDDALFYDTPKLVEHIDKPAQVAMQKFYTKFFTSLSETMGVRNKNLDVLDLCSSWVSHFPPSYETKSSRVAGLGMNEGELKLNPVLTEYRVQDLNKDPKLPYEDKSFDAVVCALSIDYLNKPLKVVREMARVLRPGGAVAIVFSNRLFITKAVGVWTGADDVDHAYTVGAYIHYGAKDLLSPPEALDLSPSRKDGDPLYAVIAYRRST